MERSFKHFILVFLALPLGCGFHGEAKDLPNSSASFTAMELNDFDSTYEILRRKFLMMGRDLRLKNPKIEIVSDPVSANYPEGLYIDSIFIPAQNSAKNLIILTSGIHGVEAAPGSFIERLILGSCLSGGDPADTINARDTSVLIIHSMNPFGFKFGRRFNANNVDLNRNCYDYRRQPFPGTTVKNPMYGKYKDFLENRTSMFGIAWNGLFHRKELTEALSGQYQSLQGIYYGGSAVEPECISTEMVIESHLAGITNVAHFDLHTGYGKWGISQIMIDPPPADPAGAQAYGRELETLNKLFPASECKDVCAVQPPDTADLNTSGDLTSWIYGAHPEMRTAGLVLSETIEIGTEGPTTVLPAIINENYCHWHLPDCGGLEKVEARNNLRDAFVPKDIKWRTQVYLGGMQLCRALSRFSNL